MPSRRLAAPSRQKRRINRCICPANPYANNSDWYEPRWVRLVPGNLRMTRYPVVFVLVTAVAASIYGCSSKQPAPATASNTQAVQSVGVVVEPKQTVPVTAEPNTATPTPLTIDSAEPNQAVKVVEVPTAEPTVSQTEVDESAVCQCEDDGPLHPESNEQAERTAEPNQPSEPNQPNAPVTKPIEPNEPKTTKPEPNDVPGKKVEPNEPNNVVVADANAVTPTKVEPIVADVNDVKTPIEPNKVTPKAIVDFHDKCAAIFKEYVKDNGLVDYKTLRRKRLDLRAVLEEFNKLDRKTYESWSREDKIAFWINAYNLKMLDILAENYPIQPKSRFHSVVWGPNSIRHIEGIWTRHKFLVMDEEFTLSAVEKQFFSKEFAEPRVYLALTRASLSGPPLRNEPYYGHRLHEQLDDQARKFLANPLALKIDPDKQKVYLSALFQVTMYGQEFLNKYAIDRKFKDQEPVTRSVLNFITNYISRQDVAFLELGNYTIQYIGYNWTINDAP